MKYTFDSKEFVSFMNKIKDMGLFYATSRRWTLVGMSIESKNPADYITNSVGLYDMYGVLNFIKDFKGLVEVELTRSHMKICCDDRQLDTLIKIQTWTELVI